MFEPTANLFEILVRVFVVYAVVLLLLRLSGKRQLGQLTPMDLLTMLLISETVSPALTAGDVSLTTGLVAATTLVALTLGIAVLTHRFPRFERAVEGLPATLITAGVLDTKVMKSERITGQELLTALRRQGLETIENVALATVETDGEITVVKQR